MNSARMLRMQRRASCIHPGEMTRWIVVAVIALAACREERPRREPSRPAKRAPTAIQQKLAPAAAEKVPDAALEQALLRRLDADPALGAGVDAHVQDGVVTLTGRSRHLLDKCRAVEIAGGLRGVRSVVERIALVPTAQSDRTLEKEVAQALALDPAVELRKLAVRARNGTVTLTGTADSWAERQLAEAAAAAVRGVHAVDNAIEVDWKVTRSDAEILEDIADRLKMDARLDDGLVRVAVEDGAVTLSGGVGSLAEKTIAWRDAWVAGVRTVDDSRLRVKWWARDEMRRRLRPSDAEVERAIAAAWRLDPRVGAPLPKLEVDSGVVTLTGQVDSLAARRAALDDAENTTGVRRVHGRLQVVPDRPVPDSELERRVQAALARDAYLSSYLLEVSADDGELRVEGKVATEFERQLAARVASKVPGVRDVTNAVLATRADARPRKDSAIEAAIDDAMFWDARVDAPAVEVEVRDGTATLSGVVDDWSAYHGAVAAARAGGAARVVNRLEVERRPERVRPETSP